VGSHGNAEQAWSSWGYKVREMGSSVMLGSSPELGKAALTVSELQYMAWYMFHTAHDYTLQVHQHQLLPD
jgi:hypothetical protein